jgi:four helix bundle protein
MKEQLLGRTKTFALRVIRLVESLPNNSTARTIGNQILRSGTSVGANYRSATRARSQAEFVAKIGICIEEADETIYWLELLVEAGLIAANLLEPLIQEANEITAMLVASAKTARSNIKSKQSPQPS